MPSFPQNAGRLLKDCPTEAALQSFVLGTLPEASAETVALHLDGCPECASILPALSHKDNFLAALRKHVHRASEASTTPGDAVPTTTKNQPDDKTAAPELEGNRVVGPYRLQKRLGCGSMGVVYKARHRKLGHTVAVKLLHAALRDDPQFVKRFEGEAAVISRLNHANIVRLYEFGTTEEGPFFAMECVAGETLAKKWSGKPQDPLEVAKLVECLARAVHHAHEHQIVHRDIKPSNVLLADGHPKLSDFGLAKLLDGLDSYTNTRGAIGTRSYMAPEQTGGIHSQIESAADLWALGVILYEGLTGKLPFEGKEDSELFAKIRGHEPVPPRSLRRDIPGDLETICLKCLEKAPRRRYASAAVLAARLQCVLDGKPIPEGPPSFPAKTLRFARRRPMFSASVVLLIFIVAGSFFAAWFLDPERPRKEAKAALAKGHQAGFQGSEPLAGPFRWVVGGEPKIEADNEARAFTFSTMTTSLLEFVDDPMSSHYRVSADLRHDDGDGISEVGLFVGLGRTTKDGMASFRFLDASFAGTGTRVTRNVAGQLTSAVRLTACFGDPPDHFARPEVGTSYVFHPFRPLGTPIPWHHLTLEVTPRAVLIHWRDRDGKEQPVVHVTMDQLNKAVADAAPSHPQMADIPLDFDARGGLGVYATRATVSVRNFIVLPLTDDQ